MNFVHVPLALQLCVPAQVSGSGAESTGAHVPDI